MCSWFRFILLSNPPKSDLMKQSTLSRAPMPFPNTTAAAAAATPAFGWRERLCLSRRVSGGVAIFPFLTIRYHFEQVRFP